MADEKTKARTRKIEVSSLLSIDSPAVVWILDSIDDLEQVPGVIFGSGGGVGEPSSPPPPKPPLPEPARYVAFCSLSHDPKLPGFTVDGHWMTQDMFEYADAQAAAAAHEDGQAAVYLYVNGAIVGPVNGP